MIFQANQGEVYPRLFAFNFSKNAPLSTKDCNIVPLRYSTIPLMNVYVEYAFLDNLSMDCLILYLTTTSLQLPIRWYRILFGGVVGSVTALLSVALQGVLLYVAKFLSLLLMCIATVGFGKKLFWSILTTCAYTFVLGGAIVGAFNLSSESLVSGVIYQSDLPLFCYFFAILFVVVVAKLLIVYVKDVKKIAQNIVKCHVVLDSAQAVNALYDSGNNATCYGLPLCFVSKKFAREFAQKLLLGQTKQVRVSTVVGSDVVVATKGKVTVNGVTFDVYFAIAKMPPLYDAILASSIVVTQNYMQNTT